MPRRIKVESAYFDDETDVLTVRYKAGRGIASVSVSLADEPVPEPEKAPDPAPATPPAKA